MAESCGVPGWESSCPCRGVEGQSLPRKERPKAELNPQPGASPLPAPALMSCNSCPDPGASPRCHQGCRRVWRSGMSQCEPGQQRLLLQGGILSPAEGHPPWPLSSRAANRWCCLTRNSRTEGLCPCSWTESQDRGTLSPSTRNVSIRAAFPCLFCSVLGAGIISDIPSEGRSSCCSPASQHCSWWVSWNGHYLHKTQHNLRFFREAPEITSRVSEGISWSFPESTATGGLFCK